MSTVFNCPQCGRQLKVIQLAGTGEAAGGGWQAGQRFAFGKLPPGTSEYSRETPTANLASTEAGVKMPLLQALVSGGVALMLAVIVAIWRGSQWWEPVVISVVVFALAWWLLLVQSRQLLSSRETATTDPSDAQFTVEITIPTENGKTGGRMVFAQFAARPMHVQRFAQAAVDGRLTPESAGLSRKTFNGIRDEAIRRGLAQWRNSEHHAQGVEPSHAGLAAFRYLADL